MLFCVSGVFFFLQILEKVAMPGMQDSAAMLVRQSSEAGAGGITVDGFLRLLQLFIEKKQV